jgi:glycogen debranching enzyme
MGLAREAPDGLTPGDQVDEDVIQVANDFYIRATSARRDDHYRVLKHDDTFGVFDRAGDIQPYGLGEQGVFHEGTRFLSQLELRLHGQRPIVLSSAVSRTNELLSAHLENPDVPAPDDDRRLLLARGLVHVARTKFLWRAGCYERLRLSNYALQPCAIQVAVRFGADFADIFEVRGTRRLRRGQVLPPVIDGTVCLLRYRGLDQVLRQTRLVFSRPPRTLTAGVAWFEFVLPARASETLDLRVFCELGADGRSGPADHSFDEAHAALHEHVRGVRVGWPDLRSNNNMFNGWMERSAADLQMMLTQTQDGHYPYAGVPWFSTVFGRDGIIAALQVLWMQPEIARGVLAHLARLQATEVDPRREAEPGKIVHECRRGEMAALGEVPFGLYYGSVDATPLFVVLAHAYYKRTADLDFARRMWPHVQAAMDWIDRYGDRDGDGFVEYARQTPDGLLHQGWKDSGDAVFHADGTLAEAPIALCEVQGYVYAALRGAAELASALGHSALAGKLRTRARHLRHRFEQAFWCEDLGTFAIALDGQKRPCKVRSSNPGQCLWTGIVTPERAHQTAETLLSGTSFSGWGVRTVATSEARYNPMSYHNGSIWPHDNALVAAGLGRYGLRAGAQKILGALFDSSMYLENQRLPELVCGFERREGEGPTLYPVACMPQAWASGAPFLVLASVLGLSIDARQSELRFNKPTLPDFINELRIEGLRVGHGSVDLLIVRWGDDAAVSLVRKSGDVRLVVAK